MKDGITVTSLNRIVRFVSRESEAYTHTRVKTSTSEETYTASPANIVNEPAVSPAETMIRRLSRATSSGRSDEGSYDQYYD